MSRAIPAAARKARKDVPPAARDAAARFRILLPATWTILPLAEDGRHVKIRRLVRRRVGTSDQLAGLRYQTTLELERAIEAAADAGVFFAASYDEMIDDIPVSASLTVSLTPTGLPALSPVGASERSSAGASGPDGDRADSVAAVASGDEGEQKSGDEQGALTRRIAGRMAEDDPDTDEVSVVELPLGSAVRSRGRARADLRGSDGTELRPATLQFMVPLAGTAFMLSLSFSTPIVPLADRFAELFDAMARTARID